MRIRKWLSGLIVLLLTPSLLFASLWFHNKFSDLQAIDSSKAGLRLIRAFAPLMQEKALTGDMRDLQQDAQRQVDHLSRSLNSASLKPSFDAFLETDDRARALQSAKAIIAKVSKSAGLHSALSEDASMLPKLIDDTLLAVVIESSFMVQHSTFLQGRYHFNAMDKILIPVRGGQYKVAADRASRETLEHLAAFEGDKAETLRETARAFRASNVAFQREATRLITAILSGTSGPKLETAPFLNAQPNLVTDTFRLWNATLAYMSEDLEERRAETLVAVALAAIMIGFVIAATVAIGLYLAHALANRTKSEFDNLSFCDSLTGLPNRRSLARAIQALPEIASTGRTGLVLLDLRHFKKINDRFGDYVGDTILKDVADLLGEHAEADDFISRTGGTEFMLLRPSISDLRKFRQLPSQIIDALGKERVINGQKTSLEANAGVFISAPGAKVSEQVLVDVALALRSSKERGPGRNALFTSEMRTVFQHQGQTVKDLLKAINAGDVQPWFQPQVDIHTGEIIGAESLVRWIDNGKIRFPGSFIPAATEAGYMELLETTVQRQALETAASLRSRASKPVQFSLNMSFSVLSNPSAVDTLMNTVRAKGLTPSNISLEILEAVMIEERSAQPVMENISRLSDAGFFIELDDFGTGHSSISSLRDLKVDRVKIDRSFVSNVDSRPELQKFASALINLAKSLDISVLAEGVETEEEWNWLQQNGCDFVQGFLVSKAIPADEFAKLILEQQPIERRAAL